MSDEEERQRAEAMQRIRKTDPEGLRQAAAQLLASANHDNYVHQVHEVTLREIDAYDFHPKYAVLIPLGPVLGIQIKDSTDDANNYPNKVVAEVFVSMDAFASMLAALGLRLPAIHTCNIKEGPK